MDNNKVRPGGGFLVAKTPADGIYSREKFTDMQKEFADTAERFFQNEIIPMIEEIEAKEEVEEDGVKQPLSIILLRKGGELGLLSVDIPEEYGGLGQDIITSMLIAEKSAGTASFGITIGAHTGIGTMPIVLFGNQEQKRRYLPKLATGELVSCYALTEPGSGSDALSGKATAVLNKEGTYYILNGEKQFITNGSWADIAIVFAQVDGRYSGFIVDLHSEGVSRGREEKKMGLRGSSTTNLIFEDVKVEKENLLGNIGDASNIALNILNLGRLKLGVGALGNSKYCIDLVIKYGKERKQFGQPIISFDMQKARLADMVAEVYALDSIAYRAAGDIEDAISKIPYDDNDKYQEDVISAVRSYALEASIVKIYGSETLHTISLDAIKMHGGYGFIEEYKVERISRDNVIDMIFEGTNDINRITIFDFLVRNIFGAQIHFREYMEDIDRMLRDGRFDSLEVDTPLKEEMANIESSKRVVAYAINHALIHCGKDIKNEQQIIGTIADMVIAIYSADSTLSRVNEYISKNGEAKSEIQIAIAKLISYKTSSKVSHIAREVIIGVASQGQLDTKLGNLNRLIHCIRQRVNIVDLKRLIAVSVIDTGRYDL
ncbi:MAG: acyl-CoA dehydrogenase family protein [Nitrospinae bacterium]|nr:acyl-CoA dehydrogenase family protein [Nitrospinota bacterium]